MEDTYSVATNNRFALFMDDEDDPGDDVLQESRLPDKTTVTGKPKAESTESKPDKSPKNKKKDTKDKPQSQPGKKAQVETPGKRKEAAPATEKSPSKDKATSSTGDKPRAPKDNRRTGSGPPNERNERSSENRPPRQQFRGRGGRLPSRENQDGQQGPSGGGFEDSTYNNNDSRSRPRWNRDRTDRGDRVGDRVERGEREGERGGFRPSRGRGGFRGGKREFERRSGSDKSSVKPIDKREGAGAHNWGTMKDDIDNSDWPNEETEQTEPTIQPTNTENIEEIKKTTVEEETTEESQPTVEEGEQEPKEKEENGEEEVEDVPQLTLDEYKALQEKKRNVPLFNERRAGEDEDQTQWKNMIVYERQEEEFFPGTREIVEKLKTSGREKTLLESNFYFRDVKRFTGGRGAGRGGGGGGGGGVGGKREDRKSFGNDRRGGDRRSDDRRRPGGRNRDRSQFNVEDEKDFPSLGTVSA